MAEREETAEMLTALLLGGTEPGEGKLRVNSVYFKPETLEGLQIFSPEVIDLMKQGYEFEGGIEDPPVLFDPEEGTFLELRHGPDGFVVDTFDSD